MAITLGLMAAPCAFADNVYATIRGTVSDPTGAVVGKVQITATNTETHIAKTVTSLEDGSYELLNLPVGTYTVSATKQGFKTYKSSSFTVTVNQVLGLPIKLEVGNVSETVEVKANAVQVETTNTQQGTVINSQQITDLPLIGRNFTQLEQLAPGVMSASDRMGTFAVNGSQTQQSSYTVNGTDSNDIALNTPMILPSPDAIQEFNLITSTINPEYGRNSGGIVNALIKNGTNQFHGNIFDFYRDTFLNTHNFFAFTTPIFHQNVFGGTVGGPIFKDKTFFFLSYQGIRNRTSITEPTQTVFSSDQRNGIFTDVPGCTPSPVTPCKSPFPMTGEDGIVRPKGTLYSVLFPTGHIPAVDLNPLAVSLMNKFVPLSNVAGNGFSWNPVNTSKADQGIARVDHNLSQNNQIWGVAIINHNPTTAAAPFTGSTLPGFDEVDQREAKEFTIAWNHTFSTSTLNEARLGYARFNFDAVEPAKPALPSSFGFTGVVPENTAGAGMPVIGVTGFFTLGFSANGPQPRKDQNYQFTDNFSKVVGKHTLKFGFDARRFQVDNPFFGNNDGNFTFGGSGTFTTQDPGADFLLGMPDQYLQGAGGVINARAYEYYGYGQDSWKVRNNLTLNYGMGYQIDTPYNNNQFGGKAFNCFIIGQQSTVFPSAPPGLDFPGDPGCTKSGTTIHYGHIAPRFGFAWSPGFGGKWTGADRSKFAIRGGFGVYFNRFEEETALQNLGAPPYGISSLGAADQGGSPTFATPFNDITGNPSLSEPNKFPFNSFPKPGDPSVDFSIFEPFSISTISPSQSTPYAMNFNLNIQREFPGNTVMTVGYVGSLGRHLYRAFEGNTITRAGAAACAANPVCVGNRVIQHIVFPTHSLAPGDIFGSVGVEATDGTSNYSALQININKGMTHGLQLITSYTWSHAIDNGSGFENSSFGNRGTNILVPSLNVGDSGNDARQRLVLGYVYLVPNLHHMVSALPDRIFGGWKFSGITTFQGGFPVNPNDTGFRSLTCDALSFYGCPDNPNQLVSSIQTLNIRSTTSFKPGKQDYFFNPADFGRQAIGTYGNSGRDSVHGPGIMNTDFALLKDTKIRENMNFEMGLEAYNLFNHTNFCTATSCVNMNTASSNFGRVTAAGPGRLVQLRAKWSF
jgi:hypothetical protein